MSVHIIYDAVTRRPKMIYKYDKPTPPPKTGPTEKVFSMGRGFYDQFRDHDELLRAISLSPESDGNEQ